MDIAMRFGLSFLSVSTLAALALAAPAFGSPSLLGNTDDGTYRTEQVYSTAECTALCKEDAKTCRGTITVQMDTSKPEMICRLNNGKGAEPAFPSVPPTPLDMDVALADLNAYRAQANLAPLVYNAKLNKASEIHAEDMASLLFLYRGGERRLRSKILGQGLSGLAEKPGSQCEFVDAGSHRIWPRPRL